MCPKLGFRKVTFEGDAQVIVKAIGFSIDISSFQTKMEQKITFNYREGNGVAHKLAHMAFCYVGIHNWI